MAKKIKSKKQSNKKQRDIPSYSLNYPVQDIPGMPQLGKLGKIQGQGLPIGALPQKDVQIPEDVKKEIEKIRDNLKDFKKAILKKFSYIQSIGIAPPQSAVLFEEEEDVVKEKDERLIHLVIIIPEENFKEITKVKTEAVRLVQNIKPRVWVHVKTPVDLWEHSFDGKYAFVEAISMSFPLHDDSFLGALRAAAIHKNLVLRKFEKYVVSYVLAGSLTRGQATETSDVDIYVVIDDTDVKRMSRFELKEKLRAIIWSYTTQASELAGVKNKLNPQIYILTDFWEAVKDAHPVIFTFIRDGVPLYDRGAFMPWKLLLKMGKIKPSPEAIDMFMSMGERVSDTVRAKLNRIATEDIYWGIITPSQAILMLHGIAPPTPKETVSLMKEVFVDKEKLLEKKYVDILDKIVSMYKKYEHAEIKSISGKDIDLLLNQSSDYIKRLKELMQQIEKKTAQRELNEAYKTVFELLKTILGQGSEEILVKKFKKELIDETKISSGNLTLLNKIIKIKKTPKAKITKKDLADLKRCVHELTTSLLDYHQRKELIETTKHKIDIFYKTEIEGKEIMKRGELFVFKDSAFIIPDSNEDLIKKFSKGKLENADQKELKSYLTQKEKIDKRIVPELFLILKQIFGEFELVF